MTSFTARKRAYLAGTAAPPPAGLLSGSVNLSPTTPVNLTSLANTANSDWAHWGFSSAAGFDHKSNLISNVSLVGGATSSLQYPSSPIGFTWTDGTPDSAETNTTTFIYCAPGANGRGYSFTVPADQTVRTLLVWIEPMTPRCCSPRR